MHLAVASGKGGTGKTFFSTNLAWHLAEAGHEVSYVDTDVEAPNGHLFLHPKGIEEVRFSVIVPTLQDSTCSGCGACQQACAFNAIITLKDRVMVFPELCHGCGACFLSCEQNALTEAQREVGTLYHGRSGNISFWSGVLDIGEAKSPPLIKGLIDYVETESNSKDRIIILDTPPGTSCSMLSVVRNADLVLLVTEPTPFGLHDLELAVQTCRALDKPTCVVINRSDLGNQEALSYLEQQSIPLLGEIPFSRDIASAYSRGELAAKTLPFLRSSLERVAWTMIERFS